MLAFLLCLIAAACSESNSTAPDAISLVTNGKIYFLSGDSSGQPATYVTDDSVGTSRIFLRNSIVLSPMRNGQMLVARQTGGGTVASIVDESGVLVRDISTTGPINYNIVLSPTGTTLMYAIGAKSYRLKNINSGVDIELTNIGLEDGAVAFSRDGARVAFYEFDGGTYGYLSRLVVANVDGTGRIVVTDSALKIGGGYSGLAWSAAGDRLIYTRGIPYEPELWSIGVDGSAPIKLSGSIKTASMPAVSPDGKSVLFSARSNSVVSADIWRVAIDGSNLHRVTTDSTMKSIALYPHWSADGEKFIYVDRRDSAGVEKSILRMVDVATGASTSLNPNAHVVWAYWDY